MVVPRGSSLSPVTWPPSCASTRRCSCPRWSPSRKREPSVSIVPYACARAAHLESVLGLGVSVPLDRSNNEATQSDTHIQGLIPRHHGSMGGGEVLRRGGTPG